MGCVHSSEERGDTLLRSPDRLSLSPVLLGGSPASGSKKLLECHRIPSLGMEAPPPLDTTVAFCPYFQVAAEKREEWRRQCYAVGQQAAANAGALFHRASFSDDLAHLRETFVDASALLRHLQNCRQTFCSVLELSSIERVEVHGPPAELEKIGREVESIGGCHCVLFELRPDSIRRQGLEAPVRLDGNGLISVGHYFRIDEKDLPLFKCYHCAAFSDVAGKAVGLERHAFSFCDGGIAHLSEDFLDAEAALRHLMCLAPTHAQAMQKSMSFFLEIHGPEKELGRLRSWLALASAKKIEDEDIEGVSGFQLAEASARRQGLDSPRPTIEAGTTAADAVVEMLSKAAMYDLGSSRTVPRCAPRTVEASPPKMERKVIFADPPVDEALLDVEPHHLDTTVALSLYFGITPEALEAWKDCGAGLCDAAEGDEAALFYGVGFSRDGAHVRAGFRDASALLAHLEQCGATLQAALGFSAPLRAEVHAPRAELAKVRRGWGDLPRAAAAWAPEYAELAPDSLRAPRSHSGKRGSDSVITICHRFHVEESKLAAFRRAHCGDFREKAKVARGIEHHAFSFCDEGSVHLRQGFTDAHAALAHLRSLATVYAAALDAAALPSLEVHGPAQEVEKVHRWAASAAQRAGRVDEGTEAAARLLGEASTFVLDGRALRRTFVGRPAPADLRAAAARRAAALAAPTPARAAVTLLPSPPLGRLASGEEPPPPRQATAMRLGDVFGLAEVDLSASLPSQEEPEPLPQQLLERLGEVAGDQAPAPVAHRALIVPEGSGAEAGEADVERYALQDGRFIELRSGQLTVIGAENKEEANALLEEWQKAQLEHGAPTAPLPPCVWCL